ncbi:hypothetical protein NGA60_09460 [Lactococcus formosensis]|uniref:hypothetical protein n=1 Tax=Lactococcus formosensis TaxID=1281486 RepID=UPI002434FF9E|nr:hypothetical protein [Lactococcus formosensis]MDG6152232.1 hypothetical protein [Lactococcus formosensis]MDG6181857.1 hypothetical protein [Lactococcus formosensis]
MNIHQITNGAITLLGLVGAGLIVKHWKEAAFLKIAGVIGAGSIVWAMLSGKDLFGMAWKVVTSVLGVFGLHM